MVRISTFLLMAVSTSFLLTGCFDQSASTSNSPATSVAAAKVKAPFRILAGSELKDIASEVKDFGKRSGTPVEFVFSGSIDAVDQLLDVHTFDAVWVSHGKYSQLVSGVKEQIKASEKTMYSRVVLGVKPEKAKALGWESGKVTWTQVIAAAEAKKFRFAMANPAGSNSGFVTLVGVASELSGKGDALQESDIPDSQLQRFFSGISITSGSSGELAQKFKDNPDAADGIVNYESVIASLNTGVNPIALKVIVPKEGVITADYPLMLLSGSKNEAFYRDLVKYLRSDATQVLMKNSFRTPLQGSASDDITNELPFPGNLKVVDAVLRSFLNSYSKPVTSYFVIDVSGSMSGQRLLDMKNSFNALVSTDGSVAGRFSTFRSRENVTMVPFANDVFKAYQMKLTANTDSNNQVLSWTKGFINSLEAGGGTAIYDALASVYGDAQYQLKKGDRTVSIVLFTDGANTSGANFDDFAEMVNRLGAPKVPVFTIQYGDANVGEMRSIASITGGRLFDASNVSLKQTLRTIRAYQ